MMLFIEGDFHTKECGLCEFHCWPSCHPAQVGPESVYGCTHKAWPQNKANDFVPIVSCGGKLSACNLPPNVVRRALGGKHRREENLKRKLFAVQGEIRWLEEVLNVEVKP